MLPGDVVEIAPNIEHWHGAAPDSWFSHLAIECNPQTNKNTWLERVSDQQYAEATKDNVATGLKATDPNWTEYLVILQKKCRNMVTWMLKPALW